MTDIEKIRDWLSTYPGMNRLHDLRVDYYEPNPDNGSIAPSGLVEVSRAEDILGNVTVKNQYNFGLYYVLTKAMDDDAGATENADFVMDFQNWVQEQSVRHLAPTFGDEPDRETSAAQNGELYAADEEGTAVYLIQLSVNFTKHYEVI